MANQWREFPELSWSHTRDQIFRECPLKYYFQYYASHNGWDQHASELNRKAYRLKQIYNLYTLFGESIHYLIERALFKLRQGDPPTEEDMLRAVKRLLNSAVRDSSRRAEWRHYPKRIRMLHELYYDMELPEERRILIKERIESCVPNFFKSGSYQEILSSNGNRIIECEQLNTVFLQGNKVFVKLDVLYQKEDGTFVIVDWKTGNENDRNNLQVMLYMLYVHETYSVPFEKIEARMEYLPEQKCTVVKYMPFEMEQVKKSVLDSIEEMKGYLEDPIENRAMPQQEFQASPSPHKCISCNFREICNQKKL